MNRKQQIISELEDEFNLELDSNWDDGYLCDGDTCRHSECECWEYFRKAVYNQLFKQKENELC